MHMRKKKWARPELAACPWYVDAPETLRGQWRAHFDADQPLHIELGCGKGVATALMVREHPEVNYIAVDISPDVLGDARRNIARAWGDQEVRNTLLTRLDIEYIQHFFAPEDGVERIYIRFCNPWPRRRHHKRRLTHPRQLRQYRDFLRPGAEIWFKTDDNDLFRDSLRYFAQEGFRPRFLTDDLHASGFQPNYVSEHERMFAAQGLPIHFGIFVMEALPDKAPTADDLSSEDSADA
ncbi:MAG: tRNA (guanosine(46)-N7)-methyltransferase TrmB [Clostridia bacterium]|nr:tRNA (guanosine(46)-N7)-methyltransferase TrmB [Clostridia bacterium]